MCQNSKERTVGLGPGIQFGGDGLTVKALNGYFEQTYALRPAGIKVNVLITKVYRLGDRSNRSPSIV